MAFTDCNQKIGSDYGRQALQEDRVKRVDNRWIRPLTVYLEDEMITSDDFG